MKTDRSSQSRPHACRSLLPLPEDDFANEIEEQKKYFKSGNPPTILETVEFYRAQKIGLVMFTVDTEFEIGRRRIPNDELLEAAKANSDMMMAFGSVDPHKGKMGLREVKKLIAEGISGFKFHPTCQGFFPNDRMAYPMYEAMAEAKMPVIFHSGIRAWVPGCGAVAACG
jgi:predicted TIM-barrel fold metal-dependent hydrolase